MAKWSGHVTVGGRWARGAQSPGVLATDQKVRGSNPFGRALLVETTPQVRAPDRPHGPGLLRSPDDTDRGRHSTSRSRLSASARSTSLGGRNANTRLQSVHASPALSRSRACCTRCPCSAPPGTAADRGPSTNAGGLSDSSIPPLLDHPRPAPPRPSVKADHRRRVSRHRLQPVATQRFGPVSLHMPAR